jgi:2-methylcitrate dehydratase PrpD
MAVTALRGKMDLCSFEDEFLHDDRVRQLAEKVKVSPNVELDRHYPKYWPGRVFVRVIDGAIVSEEVIIPKGESGNPMSAGEIEEKFLSLAAPVVGDERALLVQKAIASLDERQSLEGVLAALADRDESGA